MLCVVRDLHAALDSGDQGGCGTVRPEFGGGRASPG
jgi:hypothetical protein